ncbi:uncharacterized protein LOC117209470 [Bombus bifarius]|uniref:Uncharacterized protein LOC117209470 n=1 Tax=Bombus bifarius TaxID=103933 RepID=A0A6P8M1X6_9HYME|nr:uncharacterized protein LOC117209470 [Bombus bifarius]
MATPQESNTEMVDAASTSSGIDPTVGAIIDSWQKERETSTQRFNLLEAEIARINDKLASTQMRNGSEASSLITIKEINPTTTDQSVFREPPPMPQPPQSPEGRAFLQRSTQPELKATDVIRCISQLNGENDIGVEEFVREVEEMRVMCSEQYLLLRMIKTERISGKAAMAIRSVHISEYAHLYQVLRQNLATRTSVRENQDQLRDTRQAFNESVQSYITRFRQAYNELQHSITNEYPDEMNRRAVSDRILKDSITDFVRGLKLEIGQMLLTTPPQNFIEAEKRAIEIERYFHEYRTRKQRTIRPDNRPRPVANFTSTPPRAIQNGFAQQPNTVFRRTERAPLEERAQIQCFKCKRFGHRSNQCPNFRTPSLQQRAPPINFTKMETKESGSMQLLQGELPTVLLGPAGQSKRTFLVDSGAGINLLKRKRTSRTEPVPVKKFTMGHSEFQTSERVVIDLFDKKIDFHVIDDDFPLIEDGILGFPALRQFKFNLSNNELKLDNNTILVQPVTTISPGQAISKTVYLEGRPTPVCFINGEKALREPIEKILLYYLDVFNLETELLPCTSLAKHTITLKENKIINTKSYRPHECHKTEIRRQMDEMLRKNIIEPSDSPYNSPVWVVPKKQEASGEQKWRIVIDFRKLNELTDQDAYPLPDIDDIISQLGNAKFFSALDLSSGFHQIPMDPKSK